MHPDGYGKEDILGPENKGVPSRESIVALVKKRLNISPEDTTPESLEKIYDYLFEQMQTLGYVFHGFNGAFLDSIAKNGLDPQINMQNNPEILEMEEIGRRYGDCRMVGFKGVDSKGKIYYDTSPRHTYSYAALSPEWFAHFTGYGFAFSEKRVDGDAFSKRNYSVAQNNIQEIIKMYKMSNNDAEKVQSFFEKYWNIFASSNNAPQVTLIRRKEVGKKLMADNFEAFMDYYKKDFTEIFFVLGHNGNYSTKDVIKPTDFVVIQLPKP